MKSIVYLAGAALLFSATCAMAKPAYVASTVNLRAAPGTGSEIVSKIPGGSLVDAGECSEGWCAVTWQDKSGFAIQTSLDTSGRVPAPRQSARANGPARADGYVPMPGQGYAEDGPVYYDAPPPYYYGPGPAYYGYRSRYWGYRRHYW